MKRCIALFFAVALCFTASASPPEEPHAEIIADGAGVRLDTADPVRHLYIEWDLPPGPWELITYSADGELRLECGKNDFLHEYIRFDKPVERFEIVLRGEKKIKCRAYCFAGDDPPDWVQRWKLPHDDADLLLLPVREGDEFLYFGGAIPYYAVEKGMKVQLAYMTNQWMEPRRTHEALDALYAAGLRHYPIISEFQDTLAESFDDVVEIYDEDAVIAYNVGLIRRFKPEVVVGQGNFGDGMQILCFEALTIANELCADELEYRTTAKKYGTFEPAKIYVNSPNDVISTVTMDWNQSLDAFSSKTALKIAEDSFSLYSWRQNQKPETSGEYDCRVFGLYSTMVGEDTLGNDFFENVLSNDMQPGLEPGKITAESPILGELAGSPAVHIPPASERAGNPEGYTGNKMLSHLSLGGIGAICVILSVLLRLKKEW